MLKYLDKFLSVLKTDRNTFFTYILSLCTIYIAVDRVVEMIFLFVTGISVSYWGPIAYTFALACPIFAFLFSCSSQFAKDTRKKYTFLIIYFIMTYIIGISMFVQWINQAGWILLLSVPNYVEIVTEFYVDVKRAFCAIAIYLPVTTVPALFWLMRMGFTDTYLEYQSIMDYMGLDISKKPAKLGPYSYEMDFGTDYETGTAAKICEARRFEPTFVCGVSGSGKTSLVFEPMIAHDLKKKYFFKEASKELGHTALKTGLASLSCPYDNDYINKNFSLSMLTVKEGKEKLYRAYMHKMFLSENSTVYRDLGITSIAPDFETISHMMDVADNYNIPYTLIDPADSKSIGINPFAYGRPEVVAIVISTIISNMYMSQKPTHEEAYQQNSALQAVENLSIILSEMYPRLHDGLLPNLEDMLEMFNNFDLIIDLCEKMEENPELATKYKLQIAYFKKYFTPGEFLHDTETSIYSAITQLDLLLRISGLRSILCNRSNNVDFRSALENGEVIFVCTRRGDLGRMLHKAFGLFFILSMQHAVLRRPGNENTRIPNFLYIDEFADYVCNNTLPLFTMYRKYRVGTIISTQNIAQLNVVENAQKTIIANCITKFIFGNNTPEDNEWWSKEMGARKLWISTLDYHIGGPGDAGFGGNFKSAKWDWVVWFKPDAIQNFPFKVCGFKTKDGKGKYYAAKLHLNFLASEHKEPHNGKSFDFSKFNNGVSSKDSYNNSNNNKNKLRGLDNYSNNNNDDTGDPIRADSDFLFNNGDSIIFDFNKKNDDNK